MPKSPETSQGQTTEQSREQRKPADQQPKKVSGILRIAAANRELAEGMAKAVSEGYDAFTKALEDGDLSKPGFDNPLLQGSLQGWIAALEESVDSLRSAALSYLMPGLMPDAAAMREIIATLTQQPASPKKQK
jgi:hypothetical protein